MDWPPRNKHWGFDDPRAVFGRVPTKLEEVAQAIARKRRDRDQLKAVQGGCDILLSIDGYMESAMEDARAAVAAMRKPTKEMIGAGDDAMEWDSSDSSGSWFVRYSDGDSANSWEAMIDALLKET